MLATQVRQSPSFNDRLRALCDGIVSPERRGRGRPRKPINEIVYALLTKVYLSVSGRGAEQAQPQHHNTLLDSMARPDLRPVLDKLVRESAGPQPNTTLVEIADFDTPNWVTVPGGKKQRGWIRARASVCSTTSAVFSVAVVESAGDCALESAVFSKVKSSFGTAVLSKLPDAQLNEVLCKVICHNLTLSVDGWEPDMIPVLPAPKVAIAPVAAPAPNIATAIANIVTAASFLERGAIPVTFSHFERESDGCYATHPDWGGIGGVLWQESGDKFCTRLGYCVGDEGFGFDEEVDALSVPALIAKLAQLFEEMSGRPPIIRKGWGNHHRDGQPGPHTRHKLYKGEARILEAIKTGAYPTPSAMAKQLGGDKRYILKAARRLQMMGLVEVTPTGMRPTQKAGIVGSGVPLVNYGTLDKEAWEKKNRERIKETHRLRLVETAPAVANPEESPDRAVQPIAAPRVLLAPSPPRQIAPVVPVEASTKDAPSERKKKAISPPLEYSHIGRRIVPASRAVTDEEVKKFTPAAHWIARKYQGKLAGLVDYDDLIAECMIAIWDGVASFEPDRGGLCPANRSCPVND